MTLSKERGAMKKGPVSDAGETVDPGRNRPRRWRESVVEVLRDEVGTVRPLAYAVQNVTGMLPQFTFNRLRTTLWRRAAKLQIGPGSLIQGDLILSGAGDWSSLFSVGADTYISGPLRINFGGSVRIGSGVNIGHDCMLLTVDHRIGDSSRRAGLSTFKSIEIEDGVWIASRVTVLPGVCIGRGSIVAAGAVVASDVPPNTLVGGTPAKVIRKLDGL
jgi:maltose O-acetyltransferase